MPHLILFTLAIRDIIVALVLIPMVIDWFVKCLFTGVVSHREEMIQYALNLNYVYTYYANEC
jgi:hypothetical protein